MRANGAASVVRRADSTMMDGIAATIALRFGLSGLQGLDYMRDTLGNLHLIEMNPRAT
jgi:predicted ATP-grasp superfamily ATP-dependent carboligase